MTSCQHCARAAQLYLCTDCITNVRNMIDELPWLLSQLETTITRQDKLTTPAVGKSSEIPLPLNLSAADTAAEAHNEIQKIVRRLEHSSDRYWPMCTVPPDFIGPLRPAWRRLPTNYTPTTTEYIDWLMRRVNTIARHHRAGSIYHALAALVGDGPNGGRLVDAINPVEHHLVGPCPTITGRHHDGTPRLCGHMLFADTYDRTVDCPTCGQTIDVRATRERAAAERDLQTKTGIVEILANIGEPVDEERINRWIAINRLRCRAWLYNGDIIPFQMPDGNSEPVYSVTLARRIRRREDNLRIRTRRGVQT